MLISVAAGLALLNAHGVCNESCVAEVALTAAEAVLKTNYDSALSYTKPAASISFPRLVSKRAALHVQAISRGR